MDWHWREKAPFVGVRGFVQTGADVPVQSIRVYRRQLFRSIGVGVVSALLLGFGTE